jgi:hypothetical protein
MTRKQQPWETEDLSRLRAGFLAGLSDAKIGAAIGRTEKSVSVRRIALGMMRGQTKTTSLADMPDEESKRWEDKIDTQSYHFEVAMTMRGIRFDDVGAPQ